MASIGKRFMQSPVQMVLAAQGFCALLTLVTLATAITLAAKTRGNSAPTTDIWTRLATALAPQSAGAEAQTLMWFIVAPLGLLLVFSFILGLVYGKWGLPGYLQGRSVYLVPLTAAAWFIVGRLALAIILTSQLATPKEAAEAGAGLLAQGWQAVAWLVTTWPGFSLVLLYAALSTSAVGLGWAASLAITHYKRSRGQWETIGYFELPNGTPGKP